MRTKKRLVGLEAAGPKAGKRSRRPKNPVWHVQKPLFFCLSVSARRARFPAPRLIGEREVKRQQRWLPWGVKCRLLQRSSPVCQRKPDDRRVCFVGCCHSTCIIQFRPIFCSVILTSLNVYSFKIMTVMTTRRGVCWHAWKAKLSAFACYSKVTKPHLFQTTKKEKKSRRLYITYTSCEHAIKHFVDQSTQYWSSYIWKNGIYCVHICKSQWRLGCVHP